MEHPMFVFLINVILQYIGIEITYMFQLIERVEQLIKKKIRIALFGIDEFKKEHLDGVEVMLKMYG